MVWRPSDFVRLSVTCDVVLNSIEGVGGETTVVRNSTLHAALGAFTADAADLLNADAERGAEMPFELVAEPGASSPLYCYRPLTTRFIDERLNVLGGLASYAPAARALSALDATVDYLLARGESHIPEDPRARADATLRAFLARVFHERSRFGVEAGRFEWAYTELELALYEGKRTTTVIAPLLGLALDHSTHELVLGDGLSLVRGDRLPGAPPEAVWGEGREPQVLVTLTVTEDRPARPPLSAARVGFRRVLTTLRLFERGGFSLAPLGWSRTDGGAWSAVALGGSGRPRSITFVSSAHEDELRAFHSLVVRRAPAAGELAWALGRFEMGCERIIPFEALTDYLLALRALLEPEGPVSGQLAGRVAALCAQAEDRLRVTERTVQAIALERAAIGGLAPAQAGADGLVAEVAEHLRAILRDLLCGHLGPDLCGLADGLLAEAVPAAG